VLLEEDAFVPAQNPVPIEAEKALDRGIDPRDFVVLVENENADFDVIEYVSDERLGGSRPVRDDPTRGVYRSPPHPGVCPHLLGFETALLDEAL
jgi:hypothetical protein